MVLLRASLNGVCLNPTHTFATRRPCEPEEANQTFAFQHEQRIRGGPIGSCRQSPSGKSRLLRQTSSSRPLGSSRSIRMRELEYSRGGRSTDGLKLRASLHADATPGNFPQDRQVLPSDESGSDEGSRHGQGGWQKAKLKWKPPQTVWRAFATLIMAGQVSMRVLTGRVHWRNLLTQLQIVGPGSLGVSLLTACFVGMAFTIQFVREFARLGLTRSVGGVLALALCRELSPVVTAIIMAGRVGSSFAAELGTMQVSEQTDTLRVLKTDPVDYLVTPRVVACAVALPVLTLLCFTVGMASSVFLADAVYNVSSNIILDSAARALQAWDVLSMMVKAVVFGGIIADVSCGWGMTTQGGAKGVGESTTAAVVISLVLVFIADFALSWCFFQGPGDALKAAMG